jgi:lysophospholipase L1-like esterase
VFARMHPGSDFENLAVSGSTPADWVGEGTRPLQATLQAVVGADPDVTALTLGGNPLLQDLLLGGDRPCVAALSREVARACIRRALIREQLVPRLERVYAALLATASDGRRGTVVVFQYPETHPISGLGLQVRVLIEELRAAIEQAAEKVRADDPDRANRLVVAEPGPFLQHQCLSSVPWILRVDSCIHPNAAGHRQLASVLEQALHPQR